MLLYLNKSDLFVYVLKDENGWTLFHSIVLLCNPGLTALAIKKGGYVNVKDSFNVSPLNALLRGSSEKNAEDLKQVIELLISSVFVQ